MKKEITLFLLILIASVSNAQNNYTFIFNNGMTAKQGFVDGGIQVTLPEEEYTFYVFGDRQIINIEEFSSFSEFKSVEKEVIEKNKKILFQKICGYEFGCGDTEISYEVRDSKMFGYRVIYFTYESMMSTNSILGGWFSLADGEHTILIDTADGITFQKKIKLKDGLLVD
jgi:hypothetical protein